MKEGTNIDYNSTLHSWRLDTQTFEFLPQDGDDSAVVPGLNYVEFYRTWDGAEITRFTIWLESSCPSENDECEQWGSIRDVDVIPDGDYINLADCIANYLCNEDYTLTQLGMIHYDYYLSYDDEQMTNVLYPNEVIKGVLFQSSMGDFNDLQESWEIDKTKEWVIQGFRDTDNQCCCLLYTSDAADE